MDLTVSKKLYDVAKRVFPIEFDEFLEILDIIVKHRSDIVSGVKECAQKFETYKCTFIAGLYVGHMIDDCAITDKCTVAVIERGK